MSSSMKGSLFIFLSASMFGLTPIFGNFQAGVSVLIPELDHVPILISYSIHDPMIKKKTIEKFVQALKEHRQKTGIKTSVEVIVRHELNFSSSTTSLKLI